MAAVRAATRVAHARIQAFPSMARLVSDDDTVPEPLEAELARFAVGAPCGSALLAEDLLHRGLTVGHTRALPRCRTFPALGGHANARLTQDRWTAFCSRLNSESDVLPEALCESAPAVFDAFGDWLEHESSLTGTGI